MKVIFMGSPDFAVPSLNMLHEAGVDIPFCITQKDTISHNKKIPTAIKRRALELGIEVYEPDNPESPNVVTGYYSPQKTFTFNIDLSF